METYSIGAAEEQRLFFCLLAAYEQLLALNESNSDAQESQIAASTEQHSQMAQVD
jgi:hypothetical protein